MKLFKIIMLFLAGAFTISDAAAQIVAQQAANASISVLTKNSGKVGLGQIVFVQVDVSNTGPSSIQAYRIKVQLAVPTSIVSIDNANSVLPAGWTITSGGSSTGVINFSNGTDIIPNGATRTIQVALLGTAIGSAKTVSGQLSFSNGNTPGTAPGSLIGNSTADDNSTSTVAVSAFKGTLEAEDAILSGATVASNQPGFTGTGFADYQNNSGDFIEWTYNASTAGLYTLKFRYANGATSNRPLKLEVNGVLVNAGLAFSPTGSFLTWAVSSAVSNLNSGINKIRLTTIGSNGPNVDNLVPASNTLEAEDAVLSGAIIASNQPGFTGSGFADYQNASGDFIEWTYDAAAAGNVSLQFRYANGASADRPLKLEVNGAVVNLGLSFSPTGSFSNWSLSAATANLNTGINKIRLTTIGSNGPNVDNLKVDVVTCQQGTLEAEQAVLSGAVVASNQAGFTGTGYADYIHPAADYIEWTINAVAAGSFSLQFRYANGGAADRPLELKVNGSIVNGNLSFAPTGSFSNWSFSSATASLVAGTNTVRLTTIGSNGPNVDYLAFGCNNSMPLKRPLPETTLPVSFQAQVVPNPAIGNAKVILSSSLQLPITFQVFDILGKSYGLPKIIPSGSNTFNFSVNDLPKGIYMIRLQQGNVKTQTRLVVAGN